MKVLDFGLAKAIEGAGGAVGRVGRVGRVEVLNSPTLTSPMMTGVGMILGTAAYMSPEQAKGKAVDKRADIWAFGVVLYEMLTGRSAFAGDTVSEVLASVLRDTPSLDRLPASTPARVRGLLARCLDRDPRTRLRDIGEARVMLSANDSDGVAVVLSPRASSLRLWIVAAAGLVVGAAIVTLVSGRRTPTPTGSLRHVADHRRRP